jgi:hypothetical protein
VGLRPNLYGKSEGTTHERATHQTRTHGPPSSRASKTVSQILTKSPAAGRDARTTLLPGKQDPATIRTPPFLPSSRAGKNRTIGSARQRRRRKRQGGTKKEEEKNQTTSMLHANLSYIVFLIRIFLPTQSPPSTTAHTIPYPAYPGRGQASWDPESPPGQARHTAGPSSQASKGAQATLLQGKQDTATIRTPPFLPGKQQPDQESPQVPPLLSSRASKDTRAIFLQGGQGLALPRPSSRASKNLTQEPSSRASRNARSIFLPGKQELRPRISSRGSKNLGPKNLSSRAGKHPARAPPPPRDASPPAASALPRLACPGRVVGR